MAIAGLAVAAAMMVAAAEVAVAAGMMVAVAAVAAAMIAAEVA